MKRVGITIITAIAFTGVAAWAQPVPDVPLPPDTGGSGSGSGTTDGTDTGTGDTTTPAPPPIPRNTGAPATPTDGDTTTPADPYVQSPPPTVPKLEPLAPSSKYCSWTSATTRCMPEVLTIPTGWLLPQAVLYSRTALDTGGGVSSDTRIGLGDVAEFGVATTDGVRERDDQAARAKRIQPYVTASFRLGVAESRLFEAQPGVTLGFRKSFERNHSDFTTRIAELTLVASKHIGKNFAIHIGGAFWDASLQGDLDGDATTPDEETTLHDFGDVTHNQVRPFGGIEVRPLPHSQILVDLGWAPEFCYHCRLDAGEMAAGDDPNSNKIRLKPVLSWGVRYEVAEWMRFESGVRVPDIGEANLLDAQIFGQVTFTSTALRSLVASLK